MKKTNCTFVWKWWHDWTVKVYYKMPGWYKIFMFISTYLNNNIDGTSNFNQLFAKKPSLFNTLYYSVIGSFLVLLHIILFCPLCCLSCCRPWIMDFPVLFIIHWKHDFLSDYHLCEAVFINDFVANNLYDMHVYEMLKSMLF